MTTLVMVAILFFGIVAYRQAAGERPAERRLPDDHRHRGAARREPGDDGGDGRDAAGEAVLHHRRHRQHDVDVEPRDRRSIVIQFTLDRNIDAAAQDVQAAITQTLRGLPQGILPPSYQKTNPADAPILTLALTSNQVPLSQLDEYARDDHRAAAVDGRRRGAGAGVRRAEVRGARAARSVAARHAQPRARGRRDRDHQPERQSAHRRAQRAAHRAHRAGQRPAAVGGGVPRPDRRLPQRRAGAPRARSAASPTTCRTTRRPAGIGQSRSIVLAIQRQPGTNTVAVARAGQGAARAGASRTFRRR